MLSKILSEFRKSPGPIGSSELSRRLDIERGALDGMLGILVRQGKIKEVDSGQAACTYCSQCFGCPYAQGTPGAEKVFSLN